MFGVRVNLPPFDAHSLTGTIFPKKMFGVRVKLSPLFSSGLIYYFLTSLKAVLFKEERTPTKRMKKINWIGINELSAYGYKRWNLFFHGKYCWGSAHTPTYELTPDSTPDS
jgi:hypothetical protein